MEPNLTFVEQVSELSRQNVRRCYYCLRCTAGCPSAYAMGGGPAQMLKMVQLGQKDALLCSAGIWLCIGCETCGTRCPNQIHAGAVIDALRQIAMAEKVVPGEKKVAGLHQAFMDNIRALGRLHELTMLVEYKLLSLDLPSDLDMGLDMFRKGKIEVLPKRIKGMKQIGKLYGLMDKQASRLATVVRLWKPGKSEGGEG
jgi:heterodisulfide reductase subunit C2